MKENEDYATENKSIITKTTRCGRGGITTFPSQKIFSQKFYQKRLRWDPRNKKCIHFPFAASSNQKTKKNKGRHGGDPNVTTNTIMDQRALVSDTIPCGSRRQFGTGYVRGSRARANRSQNFTTELYFFVVFRSCTDFAPLPPAQLMRLFGGAPGGGWG